jgi:O-antigen ligase
MFALGVAILVVATGATMASPFAGMLIYWAWVVVRPQEAWPGLGGALPMEKILALTMLASLVIRGKMRPLGELDYGRAAVALGIFLGVNYLSMVTSLEPGNSFFTANQFAKTVVFVACIITMIDDEVSLRKSLWVYAIAIGWTAGSTIWNYEVHPYFRQGIQRATALTETGGDPNAVATTLVLALPIILVLFGNAGKMGRVLLLAIVAAALICIVLTGSRMGFMSLLLVFLLTTARSPRAKLLIPAVVVFFVLGWLAMPKEYQERYATILPFVEDPLHEGKASEEESAHGRVVGFAVAWQMFTDRPVLGVGAGNFPWAWRSPTTPYNYQGQKAYFQPHNLPGKIMSELGLLGLLSFGGYVLAVWRELRAANLEFGAAPHASPVLSGLARGLTTQIVVLLFGGLSGHNLYRVDWYVAGALAIVVCRLAGRHDTTPSDTMEGPEFHIATLVN